MYFSFLLLSGYVVVTCKAALRASEMASLSILAVVIFVCVEEQKLPALKPHECIAITISGER